jgi:hypothetical protein
MKDVCSPINKPRDQGGRGVKHAAVYGTRSDAQRMGPGPDRPFMQPDPFRPMTGTIDIVPDRRK